MFNKKVQSQKETGHVLFPEMKTSPIIAITRKTLIYNVCTPQKLLVTIILMIIPPIFTLIIWDPRYLSSQTRLTDTMGIVTFLISFGMIFPLIIGITAAPLIADELRSKTMISLVSKPISREGIFAGKFLALFIYGALSSLISLIIIAIAAAIKNPFPDILEFFSVNFVYSLLVLFTFGGITMGFSALFSRPRNVFLIPILLVLFSFMIGIFIKMLLIFPVFGDEPLYEIFGIYHFDISYHLANVFVMLTETYIPNIYDYWYILFMIFGLSRPNYGGGSVIRTNYYPPQVSLIYLLVISSILIIVGILYFKRRDISS
ncbi:MAG: ABC transporter permease [Promethearchaeota archaeon]